MATDYIIAEKQTLIEIANSIRDKNGGGGGISLNDFSQLINNIESGGATDILEMFGVDGYATVVLSKWNSNIFFKIDDITDDQQIKLIIIVPAEELSLAVEIDVENTTFAFQYRFTEDDLIVGFTGDTSDILRGDYHLITKGQDSSLRPVDFISLYNLSFNGAVKMLVFYNKDV